MRTTLVTLLLVFTAVSSQAQKAAERPTDRIVAAALEGGSTWETISYLTDNIGPRLAGSRQAEAAVRYTTERLRKWGIAVRNEPVTIPVWVRGVEEGQLVSHLDQNIVLTALGGSIATPPQGITAEVVEVGSFEELDALGDAVRGKIVLFNKAMNPELVQARRSFQAYSEVVPMRGYGASRAAKHGAVAALVRSVGSASLRTPHTGALRYDPEQPRIPAAAVTTEDADLIHRLLEKGETVTMHLRLTPQHLPEVTSSNVVAEIRGSEKPDEIVLIGGHLDSWDLGTGAIDNASGVVMVMETMHIIRQLGLKPKRTIRAVLFMNEEYGLSGANAYFEAHKGETHYATIESDAGAASPIGFTTTLKQDEIVALAELLGPVEALGANLWVTSSSTGADTSPLTRAGVVGFGLIPDPLHYFDFHHSPADTLDKIEPGALNRGVAAVAALTWQLANHDGPLRSAGDGE